MRKKKIIVEVSDDTRTKRVESQVINHLADLGQGVKDAVDDFIEANNGAVIPPVTIKVAEQKCEDAPKSTRE